MGNMMELTGRRSGDRSRVWAGIPAAMAVLLFMAVLLLPQQVFAAPAEQSSHRIAGDMKALADSRIIDDISGGDAMATYVDTNNRTIRLKNYTDVKDLGDGGNIGTGWYLLKTDRTMRNRPAITGNVNLVLGDGATLKLEKGLRMASKDGEVSLTIWGQGCGTGKLMANASGLEDSAGIGGSKKGENAGALTINGGMIEARGGKDAAGIGGAWHGGGGVITINGGDVKAKSGRYGAGIGGGCYGNADYITINGGTVRAEADYGGAGIGSGYKSDDHGSYGGKVTITGGTVEARGFTGGADHGAVGIGSGYKGWGVDVSISGGRVYAAGGYMDSDETAAGIGGSYKSGSGKVTITGGTVEAERPQAGAAPVGQGQNGKGWTVSLQYPNAMVRPAGPGGKDRQEAVYRSNRAQYLTGEKSGVFNVLVEPCDHKSDRNNVSISKKTHQINYCDTCEYGDLQPVPHTIVRKYNESHHWDECAECGYKGRDIIHFFGKNSEGKWECSVCKAPAAVLEYSDGNSSKVVMKPVYDGSEVKLPEYTEVFGGSIHDGNRSFLGWTVGKDDDLKSPGQTFKADTKRTDYGDSLQIRAQWGASWSDLVQQMAGGGEIKLEHDASGAGESTILIVPEGKTVTLDLNGKCVNLNRERDDEYIEEMKQPVILVRGNLIIKDSVGGGTIRGGMALRGSGVYVDGGSLTMDGGSITGNDGRLGVGVFVESGSFTMNGGSISANTAASGSGVAVLVDVGTFTMNGGEITGNSGGTSAVYVANGDIHISGKPVIRSNSTNRNLDLNTRGRIYVDGPLDKGASVSVTSRGEFGATGPVVITSGLKGKGDDKAFHSDNRATVSLNSDGEVIFTGEHKHVEYPIDGKEATCTTPGYRFHYECRTCHQLLDKDSKEVTWQDLTIPMTGHTPGKPAYETIEATAVSPAFSAVVIRCTKCHEILSSDRQDRTGELPPTEMEAQEALAAAAEDMPALQAMMEDLEEDPAEKPDRAAREAVDDSTAAAEDGSGTDEHEHVAVKEEGMDPSCDSFGISDYWYCQGCGKYFFDAECSREITEDNIEDLIIWEILDHLPSLPVKENVVGRATCTKSGGYDEVIRCQVCKDEKGNPTVLSRRHVMTEAAEGHRWTDWEDSWGMWTRTCAACHEVQEIPVTIYSAGSEYCMVSYDARIAAFEKAKNGRKAVVPATMTYRSEAGKKTTFTIREVDPGAFAGGKIRSVTIGKNVNRIMPKALAGSKAKTVIVKSKNLTKASVKNALKGSKVKTVKVRVGSKKLNKKYAKKYRRIFTRANAGKKVKIR